MKEGQKVVTNKYTDDEKKGCVKQTNGSLSYVEHEDGSSDWYSDFEIEEDEW